MIWSAPEESSSPRSLVVSRIMADLAGLAPDPSDLARLREVAQGVAAYVARHADGCCVESPMILLLTARALSAVGEPALARRLILYGSRTVRPAVWTAAGDETTIVLDVERLAGRTQDRFELALFEGLNTALEAVSPAWDPSAGEGALGLSHVRQIAAALTHSPPESRRSRALVSEIKTACAEKLGSFRDERHWRQAPRVMDLDLA